MKKHIFLLLIVFLASSAAISQSSEQKKLEEKKARLQKEIAVIKSLLEKEKSKEKSVLSEIEKHNARLQLSEKLLETTEQQAKLLDGDIQKKQKNVSNFTRELQVLKDDYAKMVAKAYKSKSEQSKILFILSSKDFSQAYKRIQYMKQYAGYRKMQAQEIKTKQEQLAKEIASLQGKKVEKQKVIAQTEKEKKDIELQKAEKQKLAKLIQKDKKKYTAEIEKKKKESKEIDRKIQAEVNKIIAAANKKTQKKSESKATTSTSTKKTTTPSSTKIDLTPEGKIVSDNFKSNKGGLPWPVEKGFVSGKFGTHAHAEFSNLTIHNNGIDITTDSGSHARAVFAGEVSQIQIDETTKRKTVYLQHGDYITIYHNLSTVSVSKGAKVNAKQTLGTIHTDSKGKTVMKFFILQNTTFLNPQSWLN